MGSTALNYSNSNVSSYVGFNSRKSLISAPINFQHITHMGPTDGKSLIYSDVSSSRLAAPEYYSRKSMNTTSSSSNGIMHIDKNDISGPTNFRHVQRGPCSAEGFTGGGGKDSTLQISSPSSLNKSLLVDNSSVTNSIQDHQNIEQTKSIQSLSSSSSTSSNLQQQQLHQQHMMMANSSGAYSPPNNLVKPTSSLYNGTFFKTHF